MATEDQTRKSMARAFLSYVWEDEELVTRLADDLSMAGVDVWLDRDDILPGQDWKTAIAAAIREGAFFLACFSQNLEKKIESYMREELSVAIEIYRQRDPAIPWLIPILLAECDVPSYPTISGRDLRDLHPVRLYQDWEKGIRELLYAMSVGSSLLEDKLLPKRPWPERNRRSQAQNMMSTPALAYAWRKLQKGARFGEVYDGLLGGIQDVGWESGWIRMVKLGRLLVRSASLADRQALDDVRQLKHASLTSANPYARENLGIVAVELLELDGPVRDEVVSLIRKLALQDSDTGARVTTLQALRDRALDLHPVIPWDVIESALRSDISELHKITCIFALGGKIQWLRERGASAEISAVQSLLNDFDETQEVGFVHASRLLASQGKNPPLEGHLASHPSAEVDLLKDFTDSERKVVMAIAQLAMDSLGSDYGEDASDLSGHHREARSSREVREAAEKGSDPAQTIDQNLMELLSRKGVGSADLIAVLGYDQNPMHR